MKSSPGLSTTFVEVIIDGNGPHLDRPYTYRVNLDSGFELRIGQYVKVPWGQKTKGAFVFGLRNDLPAEVGEGEVREVLEVLSPRPLIEGVHWELACWLRDFYYATWPAALAALVPGPVLSALRRGSGSRNSSKNEPEESESALALTEPQQRCWEIIRGEYQPGGTFLLHGATGSGKTELYLRACQWRLKQNEQVLVLVPEVSLTPQAQARYRARFGSQVSILHSGLTDAQRRNQWWRIRDGQANVVVGTRSAVFAPLTRLGLVIVDEEHDPSYKQGSEPRYHARQVAAWLIKKLGGVLILGSATPSLESYALAKSGRYRLLELPERIHQKAFPEVTVVKGHGLTGGVLKELEKCRTAGYQSVLLLNRRGFSQFLVCASCGWVPECPHCSISLTFHRRARQIRCHYCGESRPAPKDCPDCGGFELDQPGAGTERIEDELTAGLPQLRVARLDRDTVGGKSRIFSETFEAFQEGRLDCLLGTQMVSKGLDFPRVSLVVVLDAETGLHLPDFRAAERTFSLLMQVAGRAGRGSHEGRVLLVCRRPELPLFELVRNYRWKEFVESELRTRKELGYPPYCRLLRVLLSDVEERRVEIEAVRVADLLQGAIRDLEVKVQLVGPSPCPLERLQGRFRWHLLLKASRVQDLQVVVRTALRDYRSKLTRLSIDPDPLDLL